MDLQKWMALGVQVVKFSKASAFSDDSVVLPLKYSDAIQAASGIADPDAELILLGYQASASAVSNFFLENASGGTGAGSDAKTILPLQYLPANGNTPLVECYLPFGKGNGILIGGSNGGTFTLILYVFDKAYLNRKRWPFNT